MDTPPPDRRQAAPWPGKAGRESVDVTPTGITLIALGLYLLMTRPNRLLLALIFFSSFSSTAVINFSAYGVAPAVIFFGLLLAWKVVGGEALVGVRMGKNQAAIMLLIAGFGLTSILSLVLNSMERSVQQIQITQTAYILFGIIITLVLSLEMLRGDRLEGAVRAFRAAAMFISIWGVLQVVCHYSGIPYPANIFNNSTSHFADMFDQRAGAGVIRIASVATEPSFMAVSLMIFASFGATIIAIEPRLRTREWLLPVSMTLLVILASTSSTGYVGVLVLGALIARRRPMQVLLLGGGALVAGGLIVAMIPTYGDVIYEFTFGKAGGGSYADRTGAVWEAFRLFSDHPQFGLGWGGNFSFSIVSTLLANVGLVGTLLFTACISATLLASRGARRASRAPEAWRLRAYAEGAENALVVYIALSVISGFHFVVADFWCLWALTIAIPSALAVGSYRLDLTSRVQPAVSVS